MKGTRKVAMILSLSIIAFIIMIGIYQFIQNSTTDNKAGFSAQPTTQNKESPAQFTYEAKPGSIIQDTITINNNNTSKTIFFYPTELKVKLDKTKGYLKENETLKDIGKWINIPIRQVEIGPNSSQNIPVSITIPKDAELKDYIGGVASEIKALGNVSGFGANVNYRIITTINLKVTNDPKPIEKLPPKTLVKPVQAYIYASFALPVIVIGWLVWGSLKERKRRKHAAAGTASHDKK